MALSDYKITQEETAANGVVSAPDVLTGTAQENKAVFDALPRLIIDRMNSLIDAIQAQASAAELGAAPFEGVEATTVQAALQALQTNLNQYGQDMAADGAGSVGVTPFPGVEATTAQGALEALQDNINALKALLLSEAGAEQVGVTPFPGVASTLLQDALEELQDEIDDINAGLLPDYSVTWDKLSQDIVDAINAPGSGSLLTITFDETFEGLPYTIAGGEESYSGTVPETLNEVCSLQKADADYLLTVTDAANDESWTRTIHTEDWFTSLAVSIAPFAATITVTCPAGSSVTCAKGETTLQQTATSGTAVFTVGNAGTWTVTATLGDDSASGEVVISASGEQKTITLAYAHIYGVLWDGTSSTVLSRTNDAQDFTDPVPAVNNGNGSSPFDTLQPWAGMTRETDSAAGELVKIPKYWYKWTKSGNTVALQIADKEVEGFSVSPAHCDRGDGHGERDVVYVGRYHCHTSNWKSQTGGKPKADITRSAARSGIHNLGGTIWQWDWAMSWTIKMLYLVEYADWNSQAKIGYGCGNNSATENMGATDGMTYHTGTSKANRTTYGVGVQYRHIEGLWDNVYDWVDGCYYSSAGLNIILNPSNFSDSNGGTSIGTPSSGYPSALGVKTALNGMWIIPTAASGSDSTYVPDYWIFNAGDPCLFLGGYYQVQSRGLFCVDCSTASNSSSVIGSRLMKLP